MVQAAEIASLAGAPLPDYAGAGIVNLMSSVLSSRGHRPPEYPPLRLPGDLEMARYRNLVLLIVDGLGHDYLMQRFPDSVIAQHLRGRLTSVFPTTTAAAITTFLTGQAPAQHAVTGWHVWFEEIRTVAAVLPFHNRIGREPLGARGYDLRELLQPRPVFPLLDAESHVISPARIAHSPFNTVMSAGARIHAFEGIDRCYELISEIAGSSRARKYIYAYWPDLDHTGHERGIGSEAAAQHFKQIDAGFASLIRELEHTDTLLLLTADHGIIDTEAHTHVRLADHAAVTAMLDIPLCGEPRAAYCYVHRGEDAAFETYMAAELGHACTVVPSRLLIERGVFGPGQPHERSSARVGQYTVIMRDNYAISDRVPGETGRTMIGVHGGLTDSELYVPLAVVERPA